MDKRKLVYNLSINLFFAVTLIVFGPSEIFISSKEDFLFSYTTFMGILILTGTLYVILSTIILMILPQAFTKIISSIIFIFTLGCYIQAMFMNGKMQSLTGYNIDWDMKLNIENIFVWVLLGVIYIGLWWTLKKKNQMKFREGVIIVAGILTAVQMIAYITLMISTGVLSDEKGGYVSTRGMLELSEKDNVIVFILDTFDGRTVETLQKEDPDVLSDFNGFTYFPNATSMYSRTYPSITYLLTGEKCYFDEGAVKWVNDAYDKSTFFERLRNDGLLNIGLYTYPAYIGDCAKDTMVNWEWEKQRVDQYKVLKYMIKMILYRDMPYVIKNYFVYSADEMNNDVILQENSGEQYQFSDDEWFNSKVEEGLKIGGAQKTFQFYHLASCHMNLSDPTPLGKRSLEIVRKYCDSLKELGIYKDSTIIIVADHGNSGGGNTLDLPQKTAVPLLLVKPAGRDEGKLAVSNAPVSQTEILPQILSGLSLKYEDYGQTLFEISNDEQRNRMYYYSSLYSDEEGEVELREYKVSGDARLPESYHYTGNSWDILYSANRVSRKK